ncbi:hypothetical protein AVEN_111857-1 [Araneus ventricosus]|uniref:EB domain-containing protein n=1 Tax=Araneus ventricosus TaxID=182803 RepID=A0A4Y2BWU1_ARAVE|nr:hypothetical protein AVEN_111857-1 [Araneus ventricosus]
MYISQYPPPDKDNSFCLVVKIRDSGPKGRRFETTHYHINFKGVIIGEKCKKTEQCQNITPNSTCSDGICVCADGFFQIQRINSSSCESDAVDKTDELYVGSPEPPKGRQQQVDPKMIIIMVVLAVMFIGICVALHMFSKARFRNHRTIFNSPHPRLMHIKLGKKKGRRRASHTSLEVPGSRQLSICSQLSPLQSRRSKYTLVSATGNQSIGRYVSVHKDSFSNPPTNRRLEEAVVGDWTKMMKFKGL